MYVVYGLKSSLLDYAERRALDMFTEWFSNLSGLNQFYVVVTAVGVTFTLILRWANR